MGPILKSADPLGGRSSKCVRVQPNVLMRNAFMMREWPGILFKKIAPELASESVTRGQKPHVGAAFQKCHAKVGFLAPGGRFQSQFGADLLVIKIRAINAP